MRVVDVVIVAAAKAGDRDVATTFHFVANVAAIAAAMAVATAIARIYISTKSS